MSTGGPGGGILHGVLQAARLVAGLIAGGGLLAFACLQWQPGWLQSIDRAIVDRHMEPALDLIDRLDDPTWKIGDRLPELEKAFEEMEDVQMGDRRFPHWSRIGVQLVQDALALGKKADAVEILRALVEKDPRRVNLELRLVGLLTERGQQRDFKNAQKRLNGIKKLFPLWSKVLGAQLKLHGEAREWTAMCEVVVQALQAENPGSIPGGFESLLLDSYRDTSAKVRWIGEQPKWPGWLSELVQSYPNAESQLRKRGLDWPPVREDEGAGEASSGSQK